jgi:hypothetical protein
VKQNGAQRNRRHKDIPLRGEAILACIRLTEALEIDRIYNKKPANPLERKDLGIGELSGTLAIQAFLFLYDIPN